MLDQGASIQASDDYGRNPLHDACWATEPAFDLVELILERDIRLFHMIDSRGHCPLNYVREEHWVEWIRFLDTHKDIYWPEAVDNDTKRAAPPLTLQSADTRPLADPVNALPLQLASLVAVGRMRPSEAMLLNKASDDTVGTAGFDDDSNSFSSSGEDSDSDYSSSGEEDALDDLLADLPHVATRLSV